MNPAGFIGDASCPLPEAIYKHILNLDYVDMVELRPETWLFHSDSEPSPIQSLFYCRKQPVTDITIWIQCYTSLISVLVECYPQYIMHFLAYLSTIVSGYKRFGGLGWAALRRRIQT